MSPIESMLVKRECIASIIDILSSNNEEDKEENLKRIKEGFHLKKGLSSAGVLKKLIEMRRELDGALGRRKEKKKWQGGKMEEVGESRLQGVKKKEEEESRGQESPPEVARIQLPGSNPSTILKPEPRLRSVKVHLTKLPPTFTSKTPSLNPVSEISASHVSKKSPLSLVAALYKGKTKVTKEQQKLKAKKKVTWWDGYRNDTQFFNFSSTL